MLLLLCSDNNTICLFLSIFLILFYFQKNTDGHTYMQGQRGLSHKYMSLTPGEKRKACYVLWVHMHKLCKHTGSRKTATNTIRTEEVVSPSFTSDPVWTHRTKRGTSSFRHTTKWRHLRYLSHVPKDLSYTDAHIVLPTNNHPLCAYVSHFRPLNIWQLQSV